MKSPIMSLVLVLLLLLSTVTVFSAESYNKTDWDTFGKNLTKALTSDNEGIKRSALQQMIRFHDQVDIKDATISILHIYRSHSDLQTRRLALTALSKLNSSLALGYLKLAVEYEKSPVLKKQIMFILKDAENAQKSEHKETVASM
jgi:hypothetical protein